MPDLEAQRDTIRRRLLGWGLRFDRVSDRDLGRDVRMVSGPDGRDLDWVESLDNLGQNLAVALTTLRGGDVFNTDFGFDGLNALAEESNPILVRERVRIAVIGVLKRDPRVRHVIDVKLADGRLNAPGTTDDTAFDDPEAANPAARLLSVRVGFEAVSGDQAAVDLGRVIANG